MLLRGISQATKMDVSPVFGWEGRGWKKYGDIYSLTKRNFKKYCVHGLINYLKSRFTLLTTGLTWNTIKILKKWWLSS